MKILILFAKDQTAQMNWKMLLSLYFSEKDVWDACWETQLRSLGQEDPLEKEMATHSNILTWKIP